MAGEKRVQEREEVALEQGVILVDIEGTTTSISYVKDTLFPYVRENLKKYIDDKWDDEEFKADLKKLKEQAKKDEDDEVSDVVVIKDASPEEEKESLIKNVLWQMDNDRKTGALKQLQGHIWREAYKTGAVKGHIYDDVKEALESWSSNGKKMYVYSSGSVEAQKLLFEHSEKGDLLKYFSGHFDTEVGPKQDAASYKNIINKIGVEPSAVLFLTDVAKEAEAAKEAGLSSIIVSREGNAPLSEEDQVKFTVIKSFQDVVFQMPTKRQKIEDPPAEAEKKLQNGNGVEAAAEPMDTEEAKVESPATESKPEEQKKEEKEKKVEEKPEEKLVEDKHPEKKATCEPESMEINVEDTEEKVEESKKEEPEKIAVEKKTEEEPEKKVEPEVVKEESKSTEAEEVKKVEKIEKVEVTNEKETKETKEEVKDEVKSEEAITNGDAKTEDKPDAEPEKKAEEEKKLDAAKEEAKTETNETKEEKKPEEAKEVEAEKKVNGSAEEVEVKKDEKTNGEEKDKPHTNGVEKEEQEKKSDEAAHNGETAAEEAIKVKKVDSAAEAEPVVTPVAVAATS